MPGWSRESQAPRFLSRENACSGWRTEGTGCISISKQHPTLSQCIDIGRGNRPRPGGPGANVTVDGEFQGQTPLELALTPDRSHRLAVFKPGYRRHNETLTVTAGSSEDKTIKLRAQLGEVRVDITPADAIVRVNGKPVGKGSQICLCPR